MDYRAIDFLNNFGSETRARIIDFGKRISSPDLKSDVYILMARKSICFVDALIDFKLASLDGVVVSDRVLDMDTTWLVGKDVVIIDDALVSGTTIRKTINKLKGIGVKRIRVHVLSISDLWFNDKMLADNGISYLEKPINRQEDGVCMQMCYDIVKALSAIPKPYDIDFPLFNEMPIDEAILDKLLNNKWAAYNVTSHSHISNISNRRKPGKSKVENEFESITLIPTNSFIQEFCDQFGILVGNRCILKMRVYVRKSTKDKTKYFASFLPIIIFNHLDIGVIDQLCAKFTKNSEFAEAFTNAFNTYTAKMRFLQYVLSFKLAYCFFRECDIFGETKYDIQNNMLQNVSQKRIEYIFSPAAAKIVVYALMDSYDIGLIKISMNKHHNQDVCGFQSDIETINMFKIYERLAEAFLYLYKEKELKARALAKEYEKHVFENADYMELMNRLEVGYSFDDLKDIIGNIDYSTHFVSLFLDYAIDTGIAVPILCVNENALCRAYRHGEDVIFAESEARQLAYMLSVFQKSTNKEYVGKILMEKLLTTFIRFGLTENIFEKYDYKLINSNVQDYVKIVYYLHGPTVRIIDPSIHKNVKAFMSEEETYPWLVDILKSKKLLELNGTGYFVNPEIIEALEKEHSNKVTGINAKTIAKTLAYFFSKGMIVEEDLIKLNAAYGEEQIIPAIAAEVEILRRDFSDVERQLKRVADSGNVRKLRILRRQHFFTAMNNAVMKLQSYINDVPSKIVKEVLSHAKDDEANEYHYDVWRKYWHEKLSEIEREPLDDVTHIINSLSVYIYQYSLIYRKIELIILESEDFLKSLNNYLSELKELVSGKNKNERFSIINEYNLSLTNKNVIEYLQLINAEVNSNAILNNEKMEAIANRVQLHNEFTQYINYLNESLNGQNTLKGKHILDVITNDSESIDYYLEHLNWLNQRIGEVILSANNHINNHGEIENPSFFTNVIFIKIIDSINSNFYIDLITSIVSKRQKKIDRNRSEGNSVELSYQQYNDNTILIFSKGKNTDIALFNLAMQINAEVNLDMKLKIELFLNIRAVLAPIKFSKSTSSINTNNFLDWYYSLQGALTQYKYTFMIINDKTEVMDIAISSALKKSKFISDIAFNESWNCVTQRDYHLHYIYGAGEGQNTKMKKGMVYGIIAAKDTEINAVLKAFSEKFNIEHTSFFEKKENDRLIDKFSIEQGDKQHLVYITRQIRQGNTSTAVAYQALQRYSPDLIAFVGIAGSLRKEIKIGDVIIPNEIYDVTLKKEVNDDFNLRGTIFKTKARMAGFIDLLRREHNNSEYSIHNAHLLSDNTVFASDNSETLKKVFKFNNQVAGVEMESAGLYDADFQQQRQRLGVITIRGISDSSDSSKNDDYQILAAENAAKTLCSFISLLMRES